MVELMSLFEDKQEEIKSLARANFGPLLNGDKIKSIGELPFLKQIRESNYVDNYSSYLNSLPLNLIKDNYIPENEDKEWNSQQESILSQESLAIRNLYQDWVSLLWTSNTFLKDTVLPVVLTFLLNVEPYQIHEAIELHSNVLMDQMTIWESNELIPKLYIDMFDAIALYLKH